MTNLQRTFGSTMDPLKLWVGSIPFGTPPALLARRFTDPDVGCDEPPRVMMRHRGGYSAGHDSSAIVAFTTAAEAQKGLRLHGTFLGDKWLKVFQAKQASRASSSSAGAQATTTTTTTTPTTTTTTTSSSHTPTTTITTTSTRTTTTHSWK